MDIGRMSGPEDPNYDSVVGELRRMYSSIVKLQMSSADTTRLANLIHALNKTAEEAAELGTVGPG